MVRSILDLDIFWNWRSAAIVCWSIGAALILLGYESAIDRANLMRDMGIPIGVLGSLVGTQQMVFGIDAGLDEADSIYINTAVMFLTILYGGAVSGLGFFLSGSGRGAAKKIKNRRRLSLGKVITLLNFYAVFLYAALHGLGAFVFIQPISLTIFLVVTVTALLTAKHGYYMSNLSQGCLIGSMTAVMAGILILFSGHTAKGLLIAGAGLIYGLVGYITIYLSTYSNDESPQIAATRTNWHWIEIAGFYIFMFLAPDTLLDNFQEAAVQEQIKQLELRSDAEN
ncbi:hypothetical protein N9S57_02645 [Luminiphilus sp.]|nr:hypothetical protein [Luminiphilus sp.]MDA9625649.1 hypothetical protein [Luminiphilus sp.]